MSESIYLGQVRRSTDIIINGSKKDTKIGLTPITKIFFIIKNKEKKTNPRLRHKNASCQLDPKIILVNEINMTGNEKKNKDGL